MKQVLIATDGSSTSGAAVDRGLNLAKTLEAHAHIVYVRRPVRPYLGAPLDEQALSEDLQHGRAAVDGALAAAAEFGVEAEGDILEGDPAEEIVRLAALRHVDMVVVGSHGRGSVASTLLGSVSRGVSRHAGCPVLVVRPQTREQEGWSRILAAINGSEESRAAAGEAVELARELGAHVTFLYVHVFPPDMADPLLGEAFESARSVIASAMEVADEAGVKSSELVVVGAPANEIPSIAREVDADLIVIGSRRLSRHSEAVLGSVSGAVVRRADCPVLIAPKATVHHSTATVSPEQVRSA